MIKSTPQTSVPDTGHSTLAQSAQNPFTEESHPDYTSSSSSSSKDFDQNPSTELTQLTRLNHLNQILSSLNHLYSRSTDILLQQPHEMTQDSLKRLEVESTSSESLSAAAAIAQYPYYNLDDVMASPSSQSQSATTGNHPASGSGSGSKKFTPRSSPRKQQQQYNQNSSSGSGSRSQHQRIGPDGVPLSPIDDDSFNQVPKRFSQFIIDQQNPHISQRLDNLSMISSSLESDQARNNGTSEDVSGNSRETMLSENQNNYNNTHNSSINTSPTMDPHRLVNNNTAHDDIQSVSVSNRDDISESMGSQATIFSTRQEPEALLTNRRVGRLSTGLNKTKSLFNKNKMTKGKNSRLKIVNRTSTVRLYKSPTSSITSSLLMNNNQNKAARGGKTTGATRSGGLGNTNGTATSTTTPSIQSSASLTRQNAIKTKKGSWWYRLQLKIRQFWTKFKFYNFKASSSKKRQVGVRRRRGNRDISRTNPSSSQSIKKSKSLVRKVRENPQNQDLKRLASIKIPPAHQFDHQFAHQLRVRGSKVVPGVGKLQISAPVNNPQLGKVDKIERVIMDDDLKRYAGAGLAPMSPSQQQQGNQGQHRAALRSSMFNKQLLTPEEIADERTGKYTHLSNYISQQESRYLYQSQIKEQQGNQRGSTMQSPFNVGDNDDNEFPSPQIGTSDADQPSWATGGGGDATSSLFTSSQAAPPPVPPPHLDTSYMTQHSKEKKHQHGEGEEQTDYDDDGDDDVYNRAKISHLWQCYLLRVLYNRIQLRQEINQFEQYLITKETSDVINMIFERARRDAELSDDDGTITSAVNNHNLKKMSSNLLPKKKNDDDVTGSVAQKENEATTKADATSSKVVPPVGSGAGVDEDEDVASSSSIYSQDDIISTTTFSTTTSSHITASTNEHGDVLIDPRDQEFTNTVLNRRSMLAEMLEYRSSEEDDEEELENDTISYSSISQLSKSALGSIKTRGSLPSLRNGGGGLDELRRYGTIIKRPSRRRRSTHDAGDDDDDDDEQRSLQSAGTLGMKRSFGMNHSLNELTVSKIN